MLMTVKTPRTRPKKPAAPTKQITHCWGRRACSGHGGSARKVGNGRDSAGILARSTASASPSNASVFTDAPRGRSCLIWSGTVWDTWASPPRDTVRAASWFEKVFSVFYCQTVMFFSSDLLRVEDLANLTASDVMNRVNLGYLQGKESNSTCCSCGSWWIRILRNYILIHFLISDEQNDQQNTLSYVLINPSPDTRLELNDIV